MIPRFPNVEPRGRPVKFEPNLTDLMNVTGMTMIQKSKPAGVKRPGSGPQNRAPVANNSLIDIQNIRSLLQAGSQAGSLSASRTNTHTGSASSDVVEVCVPKQPRQPNNGYRRQSSTGLSPHKEPKENIVVRQSSDRQPGKSAASFDSASAEEAANAARERLRWRKKHAAQSDKQNQQSSSMSGKHVFDFSCVFSSWKQHVLSSGGLADVLPLFLLADLFSACCHLFDGSTL